MHFPLPSEPLRSSLADRVERYLVEGHSARELVWFRRGHRKAVVEFEGAPGDGIPAGFERCIGKAYSSERGRRIYEAQSRLWQAGFRPPSSFTVVQPVAYVEELGLFLQEKAPGYTLADILFDDAPPLKHAVSGAVGWLAALHSSNVAAPWRLDTIRTATETQAGRLASFLPDQARRIERIARQALEKLEPSRLSPLVPAHGDFHPKNIYIAASGRVTAIDLDTFGLQERAADAGYLLAQTSIIGYFRTGSLDAAYGACNRLLRAYEEAAPPLARGRLNLYVGMAFLQSLHYELCVLHTGNRQIIEPWLRCAESGILAEEVGNSGKPMDS